MELLSFPVGSGTSSSIVSLNLHEQPTARQHRQQGAQHLIANLYTRLAIRPRLSVLLCGLLASMPDRRRCKSPLRMLFYLPIMASSTAWRSLLPTCIAAMLDNGIKKYFY